MEILGMAGYSGVSRGQLLHTLRLEELQLTVQELQMGLGEHNLWDVVLAGSARATTGIARLGVGVSCVKTLHVGGVLRHLGWHGVESMKQRMQSRWDYFE